MGDWTPDKEITDAAQDLTDTFVAMLDDEWPASGYPRQHVDAIARDVEIFRSLDPQKLSDEYDRIHKVALAVGDNYEAAAELKQSIRYLTNWTCAAADAFKMQLDMMEEFCEEQQARMLRGLQGLAGVYAMAIAGRASFVALLRTAAAAGKNVIEDREKEDKKAQVALLFDLAEGILGLKPESLINTALTTIVDMGKDLSDRVIEGNNADQVMDSYRRQADDLCASFGRGLDRITKELYDQAHAAGEPSRMYEPLPLICDVNSPDFRYENFQNTVHDPGPIGPKVEEERKKYTEEKKAKESEISKRMGGRGAI